jgi:acetyl-CoA C-acetyltransferase
MLWGAERVMEQEHVTRAELDRWVLRSHHRAAEAARDGAFREWMLPIEGCTRDEGIKPRMNQRLLDRLPPVLGPGTLLTAANACRTNDGAAFVLLASERFVREHHLAPELEILATAAAGVNPDESPRGAMATAEKLLAQQHIAWTELAAIEFNEAFAVIDVLMERAHPEVLDRYNLHGGALAYGHPYGASGAILAIQLLAALREHSGLGLLSIAGAGGLGEAILVSCL